VQALLLRGLRPPDPHRVIGASPPPLRGGPPRFAGLGASLVLGPPGFAGLGARWFGASLVWGFGLGGGESVGEGRCGIELANRPGLGALLPSRFTDDAECEPSLIRTRRRVRLPPSVSGSSTGQAHRRRLENE